MWRGFIAITKFVVRWRVEPGVSVVCGGYAGKRIQKHLVASDLGMLHLQHSVFAMVASLAHALEQLGVQRNADSGHALAYSTHPHSPKGHELRKYGGECPREGSSAGDV